MPIWILTSLTIFMYISRASQAQVAAVTRYIAQPPQPQILAPAVANPDLTCVCGFKPNIYPPQCITDNNKCRQNVKFITTPAVKGKQATLPGNGQFYNLEFLMKTNPKAWCDLKKIFEYHGILKPWDPSSDFFTDEQHTLPDPQTLFFKIQGLLSVWEGLKEKISDELMKVETFVKRAKAYLREDYERLKKYYERMFADLERIKSAKSVGKRNFYINRFTNNMEHAQAVINNFTMLKAWLLKVLCLFRALF